MNPSSQILIVHPPMRHPAVFPVACRHAVGALAAMGVPAVLFHAGMDFVSRYLMVPGTLEKLAERVRQRMSQGDFVSDDAGAAASLAASLIDSPYKWTSIFEAMRHCPAQLQSSAFFDPTVGGYALYLLDQAFALLSAAYYPAVLDRRGFSHCALQDEAGVRNFVGDPAQNPYWHYARHHCRPPLAPEQCKRVLFIIDAPGQLLGMATLADTWKQGTAGLTLAVCATDDALRRSAERILDLDSSRRTDFPEVIALRKAFATGIEPSWAEESLAPGLLLPADAAQDGAYRGSLQPDAMTDLVDRLAVEDGGVIEWHGPYGETSSVTPLLYQIAKKGYWNHLVLSRSAPELLSRFTTANPNIVHSWCGHAHAPAFAGDARRVYPEGNPPYGETRALPGVPVWQRLQDPIYLRAYQRRWGARELARMYLMDDGRTLHVAGTRIEYVFVSPRQLPPGYLEEICRMVAAGGSVQTQWVRHNLERAYLIAYAEENGVIVGCYGLKHPRQEYIEAVSRQSGIDLRHYLERGYASVRPEYRSLGIGARLLEGLTQRAGPYKVFSVIAEDNISTQKMAMRKGTRKVATYFSDRVQKQLGVWIPETMLPEGITLPPQPELA